MSADDAAGRIAAHYERHALAWDADRRAAGWGDKLFIDRFLACLAPGASILDLGCGGGSPVAAHIAAHGFTITGVDSSPTLIALCRTRLPEHRWLVRDMRTLALAQRFDGILAWDSFFHLRPDDQRAMFRVFAAHAQPAAMLMFNAGPGFGEVIGSYRGDPLYHASLDAWEYKALLAATGFRLIDHTVNDPRDGGRIVWLARAA